MYYQLLHVFLNVIICIRASCMLATIMYDHKAGIKTTELYRYTYTSRRGKYSICHHSLHKCSTLYTAKQYCIVYTYILSVYTVHCIVTVILNRNKSFNMALNYFYKRLLYFILFIKILYNKILNSILTLCKCRQQ